MTHFSAEPNATNSTLWVAATLMSELISEAPSEEVARCLCEQVRELTGARTVILLCHDEQIHEECRMLYICPPRRSTLFTPAEFSRFCPNCTPIKIPVKLTDMLPDHPLYALLSAKKVESILRFPTMSGGKMNGALILLDLPEPDRIDDIHCMMDLLGPFFGVALQNALTQQQIRAQNQTLEEQIKARTAELAITQFSIDNFSDVVWWINQAGKFIYANEAAVKSLGYSKAELLQLAVMDIDPDFSQEDWDQYWSSRKSAGTQSFESRHKTKDGRIFPVEIHVNYLQFGDTEYACAFAHDITERKLAENSLRESESRFHRAVVDSPFPIMLHAEDGAILQVSNSWCELSGYHREDLATIEDWTERAYGERKSQVQAGIDELYCLNRPVAEGEYKVHLKSGGVRIWDFSSGPLGCLPDGRRLVISMAMDVTERKQAEMTITEQLDELRRWHDVMLGREDRVIEIKREVNQLLARLDEPPRYASAIEDAIAMEEDQGSES